MKIIFWGTPGEAVPFLEICARSHDVPAAVTRPDRPSGRGLAFQPSPVKTAAGRLQISVLQPDRPGDALQRLRDLQADLAVVVAYGKIFKPDVLASTRLGFLNVHFSLLPKYRGAAPIEWSLMRGEKRTGTTLFWLDAGMDTGPVQSRCEVEIGPDEDSAGLAEKLVRSGTAALEKVLADVAAGAIRREPQAGEPSLAPKLTREDARLDFGRAAFEIHNRVRGLIGGLRAFLKFPQGTVAILKTRVEETGREEPHLARGGNPGSQTPPGTLVRVERERGILVQCGSGRLWVVEVQPEGKKRIPAADFVNGLRLRPGDLFHVA
ncbi:MAG: methionyl-tRNA formyltransferase [Elusimicrobia bacterium]|nr:methionyl-tRNA formyltransferase [Elusimicrobiota bacterium]